jgi:hypothetical protein
MESWLRDGGKDDTGVVHWAGLSPAALASLRGKPLRDYIDLATATLGDALPLFMNDHADTMQKIGAGCQNRPPVVDESLPAVESGQHSSREKGVEKHAAADDRHNGFTPVDDNLRRVGHWVWNTTSPIPEGGVSSIDHADVDSLPGVKRNMLSLVRGFPSEELRLQQASRALKRYPVAGEETLWCEPAALGRAMFIVQRFFQGTPAYASGHIGVDLEASHNLVRCCDLTLACVLNYVDIYLGEEGMVNNFLEDKQAYHRVLKQAVSRLVPYHPVVLTSRDIVGAYHLKRRQAEGTTLASRKARKPNVAQG